MASSVKGLPQLAKRIKAVAESGEGVGRAWGEETVRQMRGRIPHRTGATANSIRVDHAGDSGATIVGSKIANLIDSGTPPHEEKVRFAKALRWSGPGGRPLFARRVLIPRKRPRPFRKKAADAALVKTFRPDLMIDAWNKAA